MSWLFSATFSFLLPFLVNTFLSRLCDYCFVFISLSPKSSQSSWTSGYWMWLKLICLPTSRYSLIFETANSWTVQSSQASACGHYWWFSKYMLKLHCDMFVSWLQRTLASRTGILIALVSILKHENQLQESERKLIVLLLLLIPFQQNLPSLGISLWINTDLRVIM